MFEFDDMRYRDIPEVSALLNRLFECYIAQDFSPRSQVGIRQYLREESLRARLDLFHFALVCRLATNASGHRAGRADTGDSGANPAAEFGPIVGMIEVREYTHICLLFVDDAYQRRGIARALVARSIERCRAHRPNLEQVTVRAAPYAVPIYERLGFQHYPTIDERDNPAPAMRLLLEK